MTRYVGVDLHRGRSVIVVLDGDGTELWTHRIDNSPLNLGLEKIAGQEGLADRVVAVMFDAAIGLRVRNNTYRAAVADVEEISDATASRDLGKLVDANLLQPHGEKRGRYNSRSPRLGAVQQAIVESRDPRDDRDPFAGAA